MASDISNLEPQLEERPQAPQIGFVKRLVGLAGDAATYGLSTVIGQAVQFFLLPIYTYYLPPIQNGISAMLIIVSMVFAPLANLGMTNAIFRRFNQAPNDAAGRTVLSTGLWSVVIGSLSMFVLSIFFAPWIADALIGDRDMADLVRLTLLSATVATIGQVPIALLRARRRARVVAGLNLANVVISIGATLIFLVPLGMGVKGIVLGTLVADVCYFLVAFAWTWGLFDLQLDKATWKSMLSYGLPLVPHRFQAVALAQFSLYMVREMLGLDEAGIYAMAVKFALPVALIVNAVQEAWLPYKFQVHAQETDARPFFRSIFTYYIAGVTYLWVGVSLWGFDTVRLMTAPDYHAAASLIPMLALLRVVIGVYFMLGTGVELSDRTGAYPLISLSGLVTVVVGAYVLIGPFGAQGAALASVLCWMVMAAAVYHLAQRRLKINYDWLAIGSLAILAVACVAGGFAVQSRPLVERLTFNILISLAYPVAAFLILAHSSAERERMSLLLSKLPWSRANT